MARFEEQYAKAAAKSAAAPGSEEDAAHEDLESLPSSMEAPRFLAGALSLETERQVRSVRCGRALLTKSLGCNSRNSLSRQDEALHQRYRTLFVHSERASRRLWVPITTRFASWHLAFRSGY